MNKNNSKETVYACPMHPEGRRDNSGMCPECGMALATGFMSISMVIVALNALLLRRKKI